MARKATQHAENTTSKAAAKLQHQPARKGKGMENAEEIADQKNVSRRSFLKGASLLAASTVGATALGCTPAVTGNKGNEASDPSGANSETVSQTGEVIWANTNESPVWTLDEIGEPSETIEADVVIAGGGGAGMIASIQAKQLGLNAVLLEKTTTMGGSFIGCEGVFAIDSPLQKEAGLEYDQLELVNEVVSFHQSTTDPRLVSNLIAHSGENIEWMQEQGVAFSQVINGHSPNRTLWHIPDAEDHGTKTGAAMNEKVRAAVEANGVDVQYETPAKRVLLDDEGKVIGLLAQRSDGTVVQYDTKAVILATGGYSASEEFMEFFGDIRPGTWFTYSPAANHGDGLRLGHDAGAQMWRFPATTMSGLVPTVFGFGTQGFASATQEYYININSDGERFCSSIPQAGATWQIFAQNAVDELEYGSGCLFGNGVFAQTGEKMEGTNALWEENIDNERLFKANTIEELANMIEVDAATLQSSIDRYNEFCENGRDEDFLKDPATLLPLKEGPYWAFQTQIGMFFTVGGMLVDTENRILDKNQHPIPGLYAAGSDAGGLYGQSYDINLMPGSQGAWAIHSGRNAAQSVAKYLGE